MRGRSLPFLGRRILNAYGDKSIQAGTR